MRGRTLAFGIPGRYRRYGLRDLFLTDEAAPLASPRTGEPGPGTLTIVDSENKLSISGGKLVCAGGKASPATGDPGVFSAVAYARTAGVSAFATTRSGKGFGGIDRPIGLGTLSTGGANAHSVTMHSTLGLTVRDNAVDLGNIGQTYDQGTDYDVAVVLRSTGAYYLIKGGIYTRWTLYWVSNINNSSPLYGVSTTYNAPFDRDNLRVVDLARYDRRFATDNGLATSALASPTNGQTAAHEADCLLEWSFTKAAATAGPHVDFRRVDADNLWYLYVGDDGSMQLVERTAGVSNQRATQPAGTVSDAAHRVIVLCEGNVYKVYLDNVLKMTYTDPSSNHVTATTLQYSDVGNDPSEIIAWPRRINLPAGV